MDRFVETIYFHIFVKLPYYQSFKYIINLLFRCKYTSFNLNWKGIHKNNYLVEIDNLKDINLVEHLIGNDVFFNKADLNLGDNDYLISDLVGFVVKEDDKEFVTLDNDLTFLGGENND